jgi:hypothetical protein
VTHCKHLAAQGRVLVRMDEDGLGRVDKDLGVIGSRIRQPAHVYVEHNSLWTWFPFRFCAFLARTRGVGPAIA